MSYMLELVQAFAGADATKGELMVWMAILSAGIGSGAWVGFELARVAGKVALACLRSVMPH